MAAVSPSRNSIAIVTGELPTSIAMATEVTNTAAITDQVKEIALAASSTPFSPLSKKEDLERLANAGDADAQFELGSSCKGEESLSWLTKAADQGCLKALIYLGWRRETGHDGIPIDIQEAVRLYKRAADAGEPQAQNNLAILLETGNGVDQDKAAAFELYKKAAAKGNLDALDNLGVIFMQGFTIQNTLEGERLLRSAIAKGSQSAKKHLAHFVRKKAEQKESKRSRPDAAQIQAPDLSALPQLFDKQQKQIANLSHEVAFLKMQISQIILKHPLKSA